MAIKELSPVLLGTPGFLDRFRGEARILAELADPHVVRLYDDVETAQRAYLVQEWVQGAPLTDLLVRYGRLTGEQALGVLRGALTGLAHAHHRGLVHRDISPSNILLDLAGTSKLIDFGLAVPTGVSGAPAVPASGPSSVVGTPAFDSPEAAAGAAVTPRSDVYSAAALLFLLLSGRLPYAGDPVQVLRLHATAEIPRLTEAGPDLAELVARGMAKDPARRPADAGVFLAELEVAAERRYGTGWLARSSMAGLVGGTGVVGAAALAGGGAAAVGAAPAVTSAATAVTPAGIGSGAAQVGARAFGLPQLAAVVAGVVVVAAAATAFALTRPDGSTQATTDAAGQEAVQPVGQNGQSGAPNAGEPTTTAPTATTPPPVAAFVGTYNVVATIAGTEGDVFDPEAVGTVVNRTWEVTAACSAGPCDVSVASSSGGTFHYVYADGSWGFEMASSVQCVDSVTGVPNGDSAPSTVVATLTPTTPVDPGATTPISAFTGTIVETAPAPSCGVGAIVFSSTLAGTRVPD